jgi:hypothetical protein
MLVIQIYLTLLADGRASSQARCIPEKELFVHERICRASVPEAHLKTEVLSVHISGE